MYVLYLIIAALSRSIAARHVLLPFRGGDNFLGTIRFAFCRIFCPNLHCPLAAESLPILRRQVGECLLLLVLD